MLFQRVLKVISCVPPHEATMLEVEPSARMRRETKNPPKIFQFQAVRGREERRKRKRPNVLFFIVQ